MKILQIIFNLSQGGAERFVVDVCNELIKSPKNDIYLLTINANNNKSLHYYETLSTKVKYKNIGSLKGLCLKSIMGVYKVIKDIKPDIVHIHCSPVLIYLPSLFYKKAKYVHTIHNLASKAISFQWLRGFQKWLFKKHIQPITISKICQESYKSFYGQDNAICITNGRAALITTDEAKNVKKEIEGYKKSKDTPVFIHVARYAEQKNQELLFNAFNKLHNDGKDFLLIIIGAGFDNSPYIHLNETSHIKILGTKQNVGDYLACADYFVLSSIYEGLPLSLLEAMSMGCIPISTPAGGVVDVIRDGENGLLSPSFDKDNYYKTIKRVFEKDFSIEKNDIIKEYKENYTIEVCADSYYGIYRELTKND
ncbi:MAG: glycosyltransferase [Bacteroidaceae bacterium]|nr:glycosyltransferase [Bacteroidaceae bacterium]